MTQIGESGKDNNPLLLFCDCLAKLPNSQNDHLQSAE